MLSSTTRRNDCGRTSRLEWPRPISDFYSYEQYGKYGRLLASVQPLLDCKQLLRTHLPAHTPTYRQLLCLRPRRLQYLPTAPEDPQECDCTHTLHPPQNSHGYFCRSGLAVLLGTGGGVACAFFLRGASRASVLLSLKRDNNCADAGLAAGGVAERGEGKLHPERLAMIL
jgi:hypothetical protein